MKGEIVIQKRKFDCFDVYFSAEGHSFVYADFKDTDSLAKIKQNSIIDRSFLGIFCQF